MTSSSILPCYTRWTNVRLGLERPRLNDRVGCTGIRSVLSRSIKPSAFPVARELQPLNVTQHRLIDLTDPQVVVFFDQKDTKSLFRLTVHSESREQRSQAGSALRRLQLERRRQCHAEQPGLAHEGANGTDPTPQSVSFLPHSETQSQQGVGTPVNQGDSGFTVRDLTPTLRRKLFNRTAKRLLEAIEATTTQVVCSRCRKAMAPTVVPDWPSRLRAHDLILSLMGAYPPRTVAPVKSKLPVVTEPQWKRRLMAEVSRTS